MQLYCSDCLQNEAIKVSPSACATFSEHKKARDGNPKEYRLDLVCLYVIQYFAGKEACLFAYLLWL